MQVSHSLTLLSSHEDCVQVVVVALVEWTSCNALIVWEIMTSTNDKAILLAIYSDQCAQLWATSWSNTLIPRSSYGIGIARFALKLNLDKTFPQKNYAKELMLQVLF